MVFILNATTDLMIILRFAYLVGFGLVYFSYFLSYPIKQTTRTVDWWSGGSLLYQHHISLPVVNTSFLLLIKLADSSVPNLAMNGLEEL